MQYAYQIVQQENGQYRLVLPEFDNIPSVVMNSAEELKRNLKDGGFATLLEYNYRREKRAIPLPSVSVGSQEYETMYVPLILQAKILLWNYCVEDDTTPARLARKVGCSSQEMQRLLQFDVKVGIDKLESVLNQVGIGLDLVSFKL